MSEIYAVMSTGGSYEDFWDVIEKAFFNKSDAEKYLNERNAWLKNQKRIEEEKEKTEYTDEEFANMSDEEYENILIDYTVLYEHGDFYIKVIKVE